MTTPTPTTTTNPPTNQTTDSPTRRLTALQNLQTLYSNLLLLHTIAAPTIILHPADRDLTTPPRAPLVGVDAAQKHEEDLVKAAGGRLVMDVQSMVVDERGVFGCVMGFLRGFGDDDDDDEGVGSGSSLKGVASGVSSGVGAGSGVDAGAGAGAGEEKGEREERGEEKTGKKKRGDIVMPFCGVWKFDEMGRAIVHWENAEDPAAFGRWLSGE
jgi:hypothetical protein